MHRFAHWTEATNRRDDRSRCRYVTSGTPGSFQARRWNLARVCRLGIGRAGGAEAFDRGCCCVSSCPPTLGGPNRTRLKAAAGLASKLSALGAPGARAAALVFGGGAGSSAFSVSLRAFPVTDKKQPWNLGSPGDLGLRATPSLYFLAALVSSGISPLLPYSLLYPDVLNCVAGRTKTWETD